MPKEKKRQPPQHQGRFPGRERSEDVSNEDVAEIIRGGQIGNRRVGSTVIQLMLDYWMPLLCKMLPVIAGRTSLNTRQAPEAVYE